MKKLITSMFLIPIVVIAQVDTLDCLSYFPLHIGDKWMYEILQLSGS